MNRRSAIVAAGGALIVTAGGGYEALRLLRPHYPPTPYDDLLNRLPDREAAKRLGASFLKDHTDFTPGAAGRVLRQRIGNRELSAMLTDEISRGELTEAGHWIVPQTLAGLCALAAKT